MNLFDIIKKGSTDRSVVVRIIDSGDGTPETGVVYNTSGIDLWYRREGEAKVQITEATLASLTTAHADGGFLHISDGAYRLDLPDAAYATGANYVDFGGTVTGMVVIGGRVKLVNYDPEDSVRMGMTSLPGAAPDAAGGLPISDAGGLDLDAKLAATNEVTAVRMAALTDWIDGGRLDQLLDLVKAKTDNLPASPAAQAKLDDLESRLTATRAGYLDKLNISGNVASQADVTAINQSASRRMMIVTVAQFERPEAGDAAVDYEIEVRTYEADGAAVDADSEPTLTATGITSGSLAANLGTASNPATGVYRWIYTVEDDATIEQIRFDVSATIDNSTFTLATYSQVADFVASTYTTEDRAKIDAVHAKLPSKSKIAGTNNADGDIEMNEATGNYPGTVAGVAGDIAGKLLGGGSSTITGTGARVVDASGNAVATASALATTDGKVDTVSTNVGTLLTRIPAALFAGITSLAQWLGLMAGKQVGDETARTELRATGAGSGTFDETTDSGQAIRDRGDAAWTTGGGGGGDALTAQQVRDAMKLAPSEGSPAAGSVDAHLDTIESKSNLITAGGVEVANGTHVAADGAEITLTQGETYLAAIDNAIEITITDDRLPSDLENDGSTVYLRIAPAKGASGETLAIEGSIEAFDAQTKVVTVAFDVTSAQSASLRAGQRTCIYEVDWHIGGSADAVITSIAEAPLSVKRHIA